MANKKKAASKYPKLNVCYTVGDIVRELQKLPPDMDLLTDFDGLLPIVFNEKTGALLSLEENDGTFDD